VDANAVYVSHLISFPMKTATVPVMAPVTTLIKPA